MEQVLRFLEQCEQFFVATVEAGQPRVRPFRFFLHYEGRLYLATGRHKAIYRQLVADPALEICAVVTGNSWLRLRAQAVFDERPQVREAVFAATPYLAHLYDDPEQLAVFYLDQGQAELADTTGMWEKILL